MQTVSDFKDFIAGLPGNARVELVVGGVVMPPPELAMVGVDGIQTVRIVSDAPEPVDAPEPEAKPRRKKGEA